MVKIELKSKFVMNRNLFLSHFVNFMQISLYYDVNMSNIQ